MTVNEFRWGVTPKIPAHWHDSIDHDGFKVQITQDWIEARCDAAGQQDVQKARAEEIIQDIMRGICLKEKTRFTAILGSTSQSDNETNRRDTTIFASGASLTLTSGSADVIVTSASGDVLRDSRAERFTELLSFADDVAANEALQSMTDYLSQYYADSERKLAPLYDIIELAEKVVVSGKSAATALGISKKKFEKAGRLMNDSAVRRGRHRGQLLGPHRDLTQAETALCEWVAEQIVLRYKQLVQSELAPR